MTNIIGYIHVCQRGNWQRSFSLLLSSLKNSQLYENTTVIRIGVVNDVGKVSPDPLLQDKKFQVMYLGGSSQYERPTLLHMRAQAETDPDDTVYYYLHTKGIKHFGTRSEKNVIGWINLMLYWNVARWRYATAVLNTYSTYGCDFIINHYSGNFWWATKNHIKLLPKKIESYYIAPEKWVTLIRDKMYSAYCSDYAGGGLYNNYLSPSKYNTLSNKDAYLTNIKMQRRILDNMNSSKYKSTFPMLNKAVNNSSSSSGGYSISSKVNKVVNKAVNRVVNKVVNRVVNKNSKFRLNKFRM